MTTEAVVAIAVTSGLIGFIVGVCLAREDRADLTMTCDWGPSCCGSWPVAELAEVSEVLGMFTARLRPA